MLVVIRVQGLQAICMSQAQNSSANISRTVERLFDVEALVDPYPIYEAVRELSVDGVVFSPADNFYYVTGHAAAAAVLRSPAAQSGGMSGGVSEGAKLLQHMMLFHNGASHARLRGLVQKAFTPRVVEQQRELVRGLIDELLGELSKKNGTVDLVAEFSNPLPARVIMRMLGLRGEDETRFTRWSDSVAELLGGTGQSAELMARIDKDAREMRAFFRHLADELRTHPQPGLLSAMAAVEDAGERLSSDELLSNAVLLLTAGHETTSNLIPSGVLALARQPETWAELVRQPDHPNVASELLRFVSPVQIDGRMLTEEVQVEGQVLRAGSYVQLLLGAANRDPQMFEQPNRVNWNRPNSARHLALAAGPHYCLGASLAKLEIAEVFLALAMRFPDLQVVETQPPYKPNMVLRGPERLLIRL